MGFAWDSAAIRLCSCFVQKVGLILGVFWAMGETRAQEEFFPEVDNLTPARALPFGSDSPVAAGDDQLALVSPVTFLQVVAGVEEVESPGAPGVELVGLTVDQQETLRSRLETFRGRPLTERDLLTLSEIIIRHYEDHDRPVVEVWIPPQAPESLESLVVRVEEGRVGSVQMRASSAFNEERLSRALFLSRGDLLKTSDLTAVTTWLSRNPFRQAEIFAAAGESHGEADLIIAFEEKRPWQLYAGYENSGTETTGEERFLLGGVWGNAFDRDHILAYQATLGANPGEFQAHGLSWEVPLHGRHEFFRLAASWARVVSESNTLLGPTEVEGGIWQVGVSYGRPVAGPSWQGELSAGLEFKRSDTFLTFGDLAGLDSDTPVEVVQARLEFQARRERGPEEQWEREGRMALVVSPGGLSRRNGGEDFAAYREGADQTYFYLRGQGQASRAWGDWTLALRGEAQLASGALLPGEQLGIGGLRTVRGYREREYLADHGWWGSVELRSPAWRSHWREHELAAQGLLFLDQSWAWREGEDRESFLSLGLGARAQWHGANLRADLGFPLLEGDGPRAHLGLVWRW
ncbi:ShlB/FhaC/HecB family hemolysin secretion/activation protein [Roseibacillus ishigakijimensis]|uniref:ShlB/FhaC/HecB family hemolysin secretion/activation protein n=1 Tax=Roseibacillus ishigakijimensis TaxID=454146 RepID=A0A934RLB4_9BACT|nr:ShlB/FhaC/HecB family hemolysin secretion/activation protein [Roseibacillus ishigakijimensis]MBK1833827.1 ShlB/FhaC/HecB family hemolysin secretion/activation protein [Roseibacillus ishigakijimensis]